MDNKIFDITYGIVFMKALIIGLAIGITIRLVLFIIKRSVERSQESELKEIEPQKTVNETFELYEGLTEVIAVEYYQGELSKGDEIWANYLETASSVEIHKSLINSNWDCNRYLLKFLLENPNVDKATILIAYWMSGPGWLKQYKNSDECVSHAREGYDFMQRLEKKYINGFYKTNNIEMDPSNDQGDFDWTAEYSDIETFVEIPPLMYEKLSGKTIENPKDYIEGLPKDVYKQIENLYKGVE